MKRKIMKTMAMLSVIGTTALSSVNFNAYAGETAKASARTEHVMKKMPQLTEEQKTAHKEKMKAELSEKLASGKITQEQYDKMIAAMESGEFKAGRRMKKDGETSDNKTDKKSEKKPEKKERTEEQKAAHQAKLKENLSEKLASGKITQEQYDKMISELESGDFKSGRRNKTAGKMEV